jgi:hypothetical protein
MQLFYKLNNFNFSNTFIFIKIHTVDWLAPHTNELVEYTIEENEAVSVDQFGKMTILDNWYEGLHVEVKTFCGARNVIISK